MSQSSQQLALQCVVFDAFSTTNFDVNFTLNESFYAEPNSVKSIIRYLASDWIRYLANESMELVHVAAKRTISQSAHICVIRYEVVKRTFYMTFFYHIIR